MPSWLVAPCSKRFFTLNAATRGPQGRAFRLASEPGHLTRMALEVGGGKASSWEVPVSRERVPGLVGKPPPWPWPWVFLGGLGGPELEGTWGAPWGKL